MSEYSKSERKELQKLASLAYDRELERALSELDTHFSRWRRGEISPLELSDLIHEYHDGVSRDLWSFYRNKPDFIVPIAIANGAIAEEDVPANLKEKLRERVGHAREMRSTCRSEE